MISFKEEGSKILVMRPSGKTSIGYLYHEVDGFYVYQPTGGGVYSEGTLKAIADKLTELNVDWNFIINKMFPNKRL